MKTTYNISRGVSYALTLLFAAIALYLLMERSGLYQVSESTFVICQVIETIVATILGRYWWLSGNKVFGGLYFIAVVPGILLILIILFQHLF